MSAAIFTGTPPGEELSARIERIQRGLEAADIDALVVVQKADLWYLAGTVQDAHLVVPRTGAPALLVRKVLDRARADSALAEVRALGSLRSLPAEVAAVCGRAPARVALELDVLPVNTFRHYAKLFGDAAEIVDGWPLLSRTRSVKSEWEIDRIREAASLHESVFARVPDLLSRPISTFELQSELEHAARLLGHTGLIAMRGLDVIAGIGVVVSGPDGAVPSHSMFPIGGEGPHPCVSAGGSRRPITNDTPVILDFLMNTSGYHADCTRMAVRGRMPEGAQRVLDGIRAVLRSCESRLVPGAVPSEIYAAAVADARDAGLESGFMGPEHGRVKFVGHGVGIEVNEVPVLAPRFDDPLVEGQTIAVEPKFTHPEWGVIGLENTYVVRPGAPERLTGASEDLIVVSV